MLIDILRLQWSLQAHQNENQILLLPLQKYPINPHGGLLGTFVMAVVIFGFHFGVLEETIADVKYQLALFAMSIYFLFK